jgi:hypothetical protein
MAYVDKYGQIVGSDFGSKIRIDIDASYSKNGTDTKYTPMIEGQTIYSSYGGTAKIDGVTFTGAPGSTFKINLGGDGIDNSKPVVK